MAYNFNEIRNRVRKANPPIVGFTVSPSFWAHITNDLPKEADRIRQTMFGVRVWVLNKEIYFCRSWNNEKDLREYVERLEA